MAGGATTPELVAAVSNAGGLGFLAGAMLAPAVIAENVARIRELTHKPFGVNLFVLETPRPGEAEVTAAQARLAPAREALGLGPASTPARWCEDTEAQIETLIELAPAVVSFTFTAPGTPSVLSFTLTVTDKAPSGNGVGLVDLTPDTVVVTVVPYTVYLPLTLKP